MGKITGGLGCDKSYPYNQARLYGYDLSHPNPLIKAILVQSSEAAYRLWQVRQQLGFLRPLSLEEKAEIAAHLPLSALPLFQSMSLADQRHALRVYHGLRARGCTEDDMLAAALLHDVGKAAARVPFWTRPAIVLGKKYFPQILRVLAVYVYCENVSVGVHGIVPEVDTVYGGNASRRSSISHDRSAPKVGRSYLRPTVFANLLHSLANAWYHADVGADLAAAAGLSERAVLYIRTHHQARGPAAILHEVDEIS
jgi:hypothetical protein